jgi:hypothetical protein
MLLSLQTTAQSMGAFANEAVDLADQAEQKAQSTEQMTASEVDLLEQKLSSTSSSIMNSGGSMRKRLADERDARYKLLQGDKAYLTNSASNVLEQLQLIGDILTQAADKSLQKQKSLSGRVAELQDELSTGGGSFAEWRSAFQQMASTAREEDTAVSHELESEMALHGPKSIWIDLGKVVRQLFTSDASHRRSLAGLSPAITAEADRTAETVWEAATLFGANVSAVGSGLRKYVRHQDVHSTSAAVQLQDALRLFASAATNRLNQIEVGDKRALQNISALQTQFAQEGGALMGMFTDAQLVSEHDQANVLLPRMERAHERLAHNEHRVLEVETENQKLRLELLGLLKEKQANRVTQTEFHSERSLGLLN